MKMGDRVRVYPQGQQDVAGIVIMFAEGGQSIAVTLLPDERHIYAHRENEQALWSDLETGETLDIVLEKK